MNPGFSHYLLPAAVAVVGVVILIFVAAGRKKERLRKEQANLGGDRSAILEALKNGERIRAIYDSADRQDLDIVRDILRSSGIPSLIDEEGFDDQPVLYLPRDAVPLTVFVLRRDEEKAAVIIAGYVKDRGKRPG